MGFLQDLGTFGSDVFTGRWTGGQTNVAQDVKQDPWVLAAPAALAAAPFALGGLAAAGGLATAGGEAALAGGEAAAGAGAAGAAVPGTAAAADLGLSASPEALSAFGEAPASALGNTVNLADTGVTGGSTAFGDLSAPGSVAGNAPALNLGPTTGVPSAAPGGSGISGAFDTLTSPSKWTLGGVGTAAAAGVGAAGLGLNLMKGTQTTANQNNIGNVAGYGTGVAGSQTAMGTQLQSYLTSGTLPPGFQAQVDQAVQAKKAQIIAGYGSKGMPTDPNANSALAQDLASADQQGLIMASQLESQLFQAGTNAINTGLQGAGLSQGAYTTLANMDQTQTANLNTAIGNFAGALAGGAKGPTIQLGGTTTKTS
jgi:hypothetical protein